MSITFPDGDNNVFVKRLRKVDANPARTRPRDPASGRRNIVNFDHDKLAHLESAIDLQLATRRRKVADVRAALPAVSPPNRNLAADRLPVLPALLHLT